MLIGLRIGFKLKQDSPKLCLVECADSLFTSQFFTEYSLLSLYHFSLCHFTRDSLKQIKLSSDVMIKEYKSDLQQVLYCSCLGLGLTVLRYKTKYGLETVRAVLTFRF